MIKEVELQDISDYKNGYAFYKDGYSDKGKLVIDLFNISENGELQFSEKDKYIDEDLWNKKSDFILSKGDLIMAMTDMSSQLKILGRTAIIDESNKYILNQRIFRLKIYEDIVDLKYLHRITNTNVFLKPLHRFAKGSNQKYLNTKEILKAKIPLPPLPQQKKIAAILDAADAYRQKSKALIGKYEELSQSLFLDMFGDPVLNEKGWEVLKLENVTSKIGSGATPRGGKEAYKAEGISLIRSLNVHDNKFKYKNLAFINEEQAYKLKNVIVEEEDVLFNITGASVCRSTIVPIDVLPARVNQHVSILRPIKSVLSSSFLNHFLISENVKRKLLGVGSGGGAVMEAITKDQLQSFNVTIPPIDLQNQFATRIQAIEAQKAQAQASLAQADDLFNSLLQKSFRSGL